MIPTISSDSPILKLMEIIGASKPVKYERPNEFITITGPNGRPITLHAEVAEKLLKEGK